MDYYKQIKERIIINEAVCRIKDYSKERSKVKAYYEIGRLLSMAGKEYGSNIIKQYSIKLCNEVGKQYNQRTLYRMRKFYEVFSNAKLSPLVSKLSWSHYLQLLSLKDVDEIAYYINIAAERQLSKRDFLKRIEKHEYASLSASTKEKLKQKQTAGITELVPNPIILNTGFSKKNVSERILKHIILENLDDFLRQLGDGFTYVGNEFKIKMNDRFNYIDLLLFNIKYNCYVVVELKVTVLKSEHTGQIQKYMNYINKNIKTEKHDDTIGIIICKEENGFVIEYCSDDRIIARRYELFSVENKA